MRSQAVGGISQKDLFQNSSSVAVGAPHAATADEICDAWMRRFDIDGNGKISREEFFAMAEQVDFRPALVVPDILGALSTALNSRGDDHGR